MPNNLDNILEAIKPSDEQWIKRSIEHFNTVAKPISGMGIFEPIIAKVAGIQADINVDISKRCLLVFCSDNGVVKQGISQSDSSVTIEIAKSIVKGTSSVAVMAKRANCDIYAFDVGMKEDVEGCIKRKYMYSTNDISNTYAMTRNNVENIITDSINMVKDLKKRGYKIIATGEAGIGNTTTTAAVSSVLLNLSPEKVTGKGAGLTDEGLKHKIDIIKKAIEINRPNPADPVDVLAKVGGADIAAMCGVFLGGAVYGMPILMDGVISAVSAFTAYKLCNTVKDYIIPSHMSREPAMTKICEELDVTPPIYAEMHLGEGCGAIMMLPLLDLSLEVYNNAARFDDINVEQYEDYEKR